MKKCLYFEENNLLWPFFSLEGFQGSIHTQRILLFNKSIGYIQLLKKQCLEHNLLIKCAFLDYSTVLDWGL